jgi:cephalosporin-C deacetylase
MSSTLETTVTEKLQAARALKDPHPFDPTYGYDAERLLAVPAPTGPEDFEAFWKRTYEETREVPLTLEQRRIENRWSDYFTAYEVEFNSLGGVRIGGWLTAPKQGPIEHGIVMGHGYGGREEPHFERGAIAIAPCARGFNRSARADIPGEAYRHVLNGIKNRETYSHRGCAADLWSAASALLELHPELSGKLHYGGVSFGGGIGALALPWDDRFRKAFLQVPSFGNHPLRVTLPCVGSGEPVRTYYRRHPEVLDVLAYFDAATAAKRIRIPVLAAPAVFDPVVPPPGQFAICNALGTKEIFVHTTGHFPSPTEMVEIEQIGKRLYRWWRE